MLLLFFLIHFFSHQCSFGHLTNGHQCPLPTFFVVYIVTKRWIWLVIIVKSILLLFLNHTSDHNSMQTIIYLSMHNRFLCWIMDDLNEKVVMQVHVGCLMGMKLICH